MTSARMIIDEQLPVYDVVIAEHLLVGADPATTFAAAKNLNFLTVHSPLLDAAMWVRGLPDRIRHRVPPLPPELRLANGVGLPGWLSLGERDASEIAFGAVGKFWQTSIEWRDVPLDEFAAFNEPGWGKIACNLTVRPYGDRSTLLTYECRTATTDPAARRRFARYWWLIRPFVAHIMRATLNTIASNATHAPADPPAAA
jgi:hypothetical protein